VEAPLFLRSGARLADRNSACPPRFAAKRKRNRTMTRDGVRRCVTRALRAG
jgi:hypothetical protein